MEMESETALRLVKSGVTLLLLDVPQFTLVGIDTQMFSVGPAFKGIKMIPPGPHFIYYSSSNKEGIEFSTVIGFFIDASPSEVVVRKWDQVEERFHRLSEDEEERFSQAVRNMEFDRHLGPYTLNQYGDWKRLSNYITKSVIEKIEPIGREISVECEPDIAQSILQTPGEKTLGEQLKSTKSSMVVNEPQKKSCYYTPIPHLVKHKGIQGQELTSLNLDKTQLLESILMKEYGGSEDLILGELQFAFVAFLMGQSLEAFMQWKSLICLFFGCYEAPLHTRSQLFTKFINVIYYQLKHGLQKQADARGTTGNSMLPLLDESWLSSESFLYHLCKDFFSLVMEAVVIDGDLLSWTRSLKQLLEDTLGWEFQQGNALDFNDDDEFAPVVVMDV
ncbi:protein AAR2 homolog [Impatiens glandulifera]|uniref:protein AAR2 homolog n=1 Tax=Impatiens glandulifera TaxID=253017 RepID=UPI001FB0FD7D|nr:protein AAR2 homolog [Impatiens glandulifera]XP_047327243.1 protein AAR2 homolog [Impatiens glandulifera]